MSDSGDPTFVDITIEIVSAYLTNNLVTMAEVPALIFSVHAALTHLGRTPELAAEPKRPMPPVSIRKSIADGYLVSLEDGKRYQALKKHLAKHGLTPDAYRAKWGLPQTYPMTAPLYARRRSELAKNSGLGRTQRQG